MKNLFAAFGLLFLLGAGCSGFSSAYVPGEIPTANQLASMTDAQKSEAMAMVLKKYPPKTLTDDERHAEAAKSWEITGQGTPERIADFEGRGHKAEGVAKFVEKDGRWFIVFSDTFSTEAGPSLAVALSAVTRLSSDTDLRPQDMIELGPLKVAFGGQAYEVPTSTDIAKYKSVAIYSKPFRALFAVATVK